MVRLYEFQGKQLLREAGVKVPRGEVASTKEEAKAIAEKIGGPVVIKAQTWATGRSKAGGIKFAENPDEAEARSQELLKTSLKGHTIEKVLVEERIDIDMEFYAGVIAESSYKVKGPIMIFSSKGGVDIEEVARKSPENLARVTVDYLEGVDSSSMESLVSKALVPQSLVRPLGELLNNLYRLFVKYEARSWELNPIIYSKNGEIYAADCRVTIDDNAVFRHPEFATDVPRDMERPPTDLEKIAWKIEEGDYRGTGYFTEMTTGRREGCIAFHGIGGGGAMLAADALIRNGFNIANYADTSGDPTAAKVYRVIKTVLAQPNVEGYILMGSALASQEQWHHAHALVKALREEAQERPGFPVLILLAGNKESESHEIIKEGLKDVQLRWELYGRDYIYETDFIAQRMKALVEEYRADKRRKAGG